MTDNEKLIEDAATAIRTADNDFDHSIVESARLADELWLRAVASAALAVFEKAHTPTAHEVTTDEREALIEKIEELRLETQRGQYAEKGYADDFNDGLDAAVSVVRSFRPSEAPEPSAPMSLADDPMRKPFLKPQGKPSEGQVEAAHKAFWEHPDITGGYDSIRAALRAAGGVR